MTPIWFSSEIENAASRNVQLGLGKKKGSLSFSVDIGHDRPRHTYPGQTSSSTCAWLVIPGSWNEWLWEENGICRQWRQCAGWCRNVKDVWVSFLLSSLTMTLKSMWLIWTCVWSLTPICCDLEAGPVSAGLDSNSLRQCKGQAAAADNGWMTVMLVNELVLFSPARIRIIHLTKQTFGWIWVVCLQKKGNYINPFPSSFSSNGTENVFLFFKIQFPLCVSGEGS